MRILVLSFYYPPDLSAGSFRTKALTDALISQGGSGLKVDVLTSMPNRYHSHSIPAEAVELHDSLTIRRITLPTHRNGMLDQMRSFAAYARGVRRRTEGMKWDGVVATSSRLMTAVLGGHIARRIQAPLYLDIRDLFTDTMADLLKDPALRIVLPGLRFLERYTFRQASRINLVSPGFVPHLRNIAPDMECRIFTNGIDPEFIDGDFRQPKRMVNDLPLILYAGNIGEGQGLEIILPKVARILEGRARFRVIGDGGRRRVLEFALASVGTSNVELLPPMPRMALFEHYREAEILFLHLNDHSAFQKVLPSKIFEYAATGKPILAGVAGCAAQFLRDEVAGIELFAPCDVEGMVRAVEAAFNRPREFNRDSFCRSYERSGIMANMAEDIIDNIANFQRHSGA